MKHTVDEINKLDWEQDKEQLLSIFFDAVRVNLQPETLQNCYQSAHKEYFLTAVNAQGFDILQLLFSRYKANRYHLNRVAQWKSDPSSFEQEATQIENMVYLAVAKGALNHYTPANRRILFRVAPELGVAIDRREKELHSLSFSVSMQMPMSVSDTRPRSPSAPPVLMAFNRLGVDASLEPQITRIHLANSPRFKKLR